MRGKAKVKEPFELIGKEQTGKQLQNVDVMKYNCK